MKNSKNGKTINGKTIKRIDVSLGWENIVYILILSLMLSITIQSSITFQHLTGCFFISLIGISVLYRDIFRYKPSYIKQQKMLILLGLLIIGTMMFSRAIEYLLVNFSKGIGFIPEDSIIYAIPIPMGAMMVSLLFDFHTAIIFSFIISIFAGIWLDSVQYTLYAFVGSFVAAFSVMRCKKRSDIIKGGLYLSSANIATVCMISLFNSDLLMSKLISYILFALTSGFIVSAFVSILLPVFEYTFKVTTDIKLLELLDMNQPLMKSLMINAPGTYHHSVIVGNLVETAAEDIGVNPLLAKVSAYYHDIGKIKMPEYFIENHASPVSRHDKLTPHMSSMIIFSHIKEGLEFADDYKLPEPVRDAISEHHGTSIISFFYHKAKEAKNEVPSEEDYRYPGPRPQSRVTALVMMADAVEASSRVLKDPTPARVSGLVDKIINNIFIDGQLDECELTLRDIYTIKNRFTYILNGIFHRRIEYPGFDLENKKDKKTTGNGKDIDFNKGSTENKDKDKQKMVKV